MNIRVNPNFDGHEELVFIGDRASWLAGKLANPLETSIAF